jgi:nitrogen fixation NifU-like protein
MVNKPYYSKKVIEHFTHPKNFGEMRDADGVGKVGNPRCGDLMKLYLKVEKKGKKEIIKDIKFHTLGCAAAIATSDIVCDLVKGKSVKEALKVDYRKVTKELGYLPEVKIHCSFLAQQGLRAAIDDYSRRQAARYIKQNVRYKKRKK